MHTIHNTVVQNTKTRLMSLLLFLLLIFASYTISITVESLAANLFRSRSLLAADTVQDKILVIYQDGQSFLVDKNSGETSWSLQLSPSLSYLSGPRAGCRNDPALSSGDDYIVDVGDNNVETENSIEAKYMKMLLDAATGVVPRDSEDYESSLQFRYAKLLVDFESGKVLQIFDESSGKNANGTILHITRKNTFVTFERFGKTLFWKFTFSTFKATIVNQEKKQQVPVVHVRNGSHVRFVDSIFKCLSELTTCCGEYDQVLLRISSS